MRSRHPWCAHHCYMVPLSSPDPGAMAWVSGVGEAENMAKQPEFSGTSRWLGPHTSRRGLLRAGLALGTLALGQRVALGQSAGDHAHNMPDPGLANPPAAPAMDQPLVEPDVRRSVNGVLSTGLRCAYAYRDIGRVRLYLASSEGGL